MKTLTKKNGFTLIELMVVVGIIGILLAIVLVGINQVRSNARDKERVSSLGNIQFALEVYKEANRDYPTADIAPGGFNTVFGSFYASLSDDPLDGSEYYYRYDGTANCTSGSNDQKVLFAKKMESITKGNYSDICTCSGGSCGFTGGDPADGYVILIEE